MHPERIRGRREAAESSGWGPERARGPVPEPAVTEPPERREHCFILFVSTTLLSQNPKIIIYGTRVNLNRCIFAGVKFGSLGSKDYPSTIPGPIADGPPGYPLIVNR